MTEGLEYEFINNPFLLRIIIHNKSIADAHQEGTKSSRFVQSRLTRDQEYWTIFYSRIKK